MIEDSEDGVAMPAALYWEWRTTCEELSHAKTKLELRKTLHVNLQQSVRLAEHAVKIDVARIKSAVNDLDACQSESDKMKLRIEKELGIDFSDCVVGEDLRITKLDQGENE